MHNVLNFQPGVFRERSPGEAILKFFRYLEVEGEISFRLVAGPGVDYSRLRVSGVSFRWSARGGAILSLISNQIRSLLSRRLRRAVRWCEIIHTVDPCIYPQAIVAGSLAAYWHKKAVYEVTSTSLFSRRSVYFIFLRPLIRRLLRRSHAIVVPTPKAIERLALLFGDDSEILKKCFLLGHPVDVSERLSESHLLTQRKLNLVGVGRLVPSKGWTYVVEAFRIVAPRFLELNLTIVGSGALQEQLEMQIAEAGLGNRIRLVSELAHGSLAGLLADSQIYVAHSLTNAEWEEYFGVASLEAMASSLPCIVCDSGASRWVHRGSSGVIFVSERNVDELAAAISLLVGDENYRRELGMQAYASVTKNYSVSSVAARYVACVLSKHSDEWVS